MESLISYNTNNNVNNNHYAQKFGNNFIIHSALNIQTFVAKTLKKYLFY